MSANVNSFTLGNVQAYFLATESKTRPVEIPGGDLLPLRRVEILKVSLGHGPGASLVHDLVHHRNRRLGKYADGRHDDLNLVRPQLFDREQRFVFPGQQNVTDASLNERGCGATRS